MSVFIACTVQIQGIRKGQWGRGELSDKHQHTQKGKEPRTIPTPPHPTMPFYELPSKGGGMGRSKPQKINCKHPEMLGAEGERGCGWGSKWIPGTRSPHRMRRWAGWGPSAHTPRTLEGPDTLPSHTHTHTAAHTCIPEAQGRPRTQSTAHTRVLIALTHSLDHVHLKAADVGSWRWEGVRWPGSLPSQRPLTPVRTKDTLPCSFPPQVHGAQYCLGEMCNSPG